MSWKLVSLSLCPPIPFSVALSSSLLVSTLGVGLGHSAHCGLQELKDSAPIAEAPAEGEHSLNSWHEPVSDSHWIHISHVSVLEPVMIARGMECINWPDPVSFV